MSARETYSLAHTARCKLKIAADRPDRNLRFILGHAFTLDKVMLRVVEIENEVSPGPFDVAEDESDWARPTCGGGGEHMGERRVSFQNTTDKPIAATPGSRNRSPPPVRTGNVSSGEDEDDDEDDEEDDIAEDDEDSGDELSLQRFGSGAARRPPMLVDDESDSDEEEEDKNEPVSPEQLPSDMEMRNITKGPESEELAVLYRDLRSCPCHGHNEDAPGVEKVWELPRKAGDKRIAVVQFSEEPLFS